MKKIITALFILNIATFSWCIRGFFILDHSGMLGLEAQIKETPFLAIESLRIIDSYTEKEKINNANEIIRLYSKLALHLDATKRVSLEAIDAVYEDMFVLSFVSLINIVLIVMLFRYNKSLNSDAQKARAS